MATLTSSILYAIQKIPGETREEKFKEIGKIVSKVIATIEEESEVPSTIAAQNVPNVLVPLIKILVGVKIKSHSFIIEALKSDNINLITEALRARWFFDGSNESITNYKYYSTEILPFVSMSTRREICKRLAVCLAHSKRTNTAEDFFSGFILAYGVQESTNLLPACRSEFIFESIVKYKIVLSCKILKILYIKYPDVVERYLNFTNPAEKRDEISRTMFRMIDIYEYENFMPLLLTKHPEIFVTMQEFYPTTPNIGNRRARMFLKNAKDVLIRKPKGTIELLPIKLVRDKLSEEEFETMFGNIFEDHWDMFKLDYLLNYLEYYPENKKTILIRNKVREKYGYDLYEKVEKLTPRFLLLLPKEERYILARRIIQNRQKVEISDPETSWWCYLPVKEAIPALMHQIAKNWKSSKRQNYFSQLIYVCKLNESKEDLLGVLRIVDDQYKNERSDVIITMLDRINQEFDLDTFDQNYWSVLFNIIKRIKLKKENARDYWVLIKILKKNVHYCSVNNLPFDEIIDLIVQLFLEGRVGVSWKLLEDKPEYERKYLDVCFRHNYWLNMEYKKNVVEGIYSFNERHVANGESSVMRFSIKDYPHLLKVVEETVKKESNEELTWIIYTKEKLKKHEPDLWKTWFPVEEKMQVDNAYEDMMYVEDLSSTPEIKEKPIYLTEAIIALKRNYDEIRNGWPRYYECCKNEVGSKKRRRVKQFLKALRWYQDIPIKFAEKSIEERNFDIMGYLFDGPSFAEIALRSLPKELEENRNASYLNALHITVAVRNTSSPIPTDLVKKYLTACYMYSFKNYINDGLKLWSYVSYRTSADEMIRLANALSKERLFMKRHAIRLVYTMASTSDLVSFYGELWSLDDHPLIRKMLAEKVGKVFSKRPSPETWGLMRLCITGLKRSEDEILDDLMDSKAVPVEFASSYAQLILDKLQEFVQNGMSKYDAAKIFDKLFENLKPDCSDYLSEDFYTEVLHHQLRNTDSELNNTNRFIVKVYLNTSSVHFDRRLQQVIPLLREESARWHGLSMEDRKPSSNFVDNFVQIVVYQVQKSKGNLRLVESLFVIFSEIFSRYEHVWSHIMLFLSVEYLKSESSFKTFGLRLSEKIDLLIQKYTPEYFMQIVDFIRDFICNFSFHEYSEAIKHRLKFLEGLIENKNEHGLMIAAKLLNKKIVSEYDHQHYKVLQELSDLHNPMVQCLL